MDGRIDGVVIFFLFVSFRFAAVVDLHDGSPLVDTFVHNDFFHATCELPATAFSCTATICVAPVTPYVLPDLATLTMLLHLLWARVLLQCDDYVLLKFTFSFSKIIPVLHPSSAYEVLTKSNL